MRFLTGGQEGPLINPTSWRNCLENPNGLHFRVPGVGKMGEEAPLLPLCATQNTGSRPIQLFTKQFLRNCLENRNESRIGTIKAARRGRRGVNRPPFAAKDARSRSLRLFSKQFQKVNSANFALTEFSEVRAAGIPRGPIAAVRGVEYPHRTDATQGPPLTQQAQVGIMQGWLEVWGLPITGEEPAMAWMGHPMDGLMPGMAAPDEITRLSQLHPDRADVLFLRLMIAHHEAAIPMAQAILKRTDEPEVRELAKAIINSQTAEIENMKAVVEKKVGNYAEVKLEPANGSGTTGTATLSKANGGGVKIVLEVSGLPNSGTTMYLSHIHPGTCAEALEEAQEGGEHDSSPHEHGASKEIEYPLTPVEPDAGGSGTSKTVVHGVTLEGLISGVTKHVNVHEPGSGEPPPVACANLNEAD